MKRWQKQLLIIWLWSACLLSCQSKGPIFIGFSGQLTGTEANMGIHGRNGVQLAVETINEAGGINGRSLQLLIEDDLGTPEGAIAADRKLIDANVVAIIGHITSAQTLAAYPQAQEAQIVLISPTSTTPELSGKDDMFFRVVPTLIVQAAAFADYIYQTQRITHLASIYDINNAAFSQSYWDTFAATFVQSGGQITNQIAFDTSQTPDFAHLAAELQIGEPEGILIIASALDTALISQHIRQQNWHPPLFSSAWAQTEVLIQNGGQAVEGLETIIAFDTNSPSPLYTDFKTRYEQRFSVEPTFVAGESYEAAIVLFEALEQTNGSSVGLPQALKQTKDVQGLNGTISLDSFGDVVRSNFVLVVENGRFTTKTILEPTP